MRIRGKITILLGVFVLISLLLVAVQYNVERTRTQQLLKGVRAQEQAFFTSVVDLSSSNVAVFVSDYTFWDDMVNFVHKPTQEFIDNYLLESLGTYHTNRIFVYDASGKSVYAYRNEEVPARLPELSKEAFETFRKERMAHFYLIEDGELIEYHAATIHPTNDPERATEPQGFLVVGNSWDAPYIASLEKLAGVSIRKPGEILPEGGVTFPYEVHSWDGSTVASFTISTPVPLLKEAASASQQQLYIIIASLLLLLLLTFLFLEVFVGRPLMTLSESIRRKDFHKIQTLQKSRSEFGVLARVVIGFSEHEMVLEGKAKDEAILSAVANGLIAVDIQGNVTLLNAAAEKLLGVTAVNVVGKPVSTLFNAQTRAGEVVSPEHLPLLRALSEREMQTDTLLFTRADGTQFPSQMNAAPVILKGVVIGAVQDFRDVTQEEAVEKAKNNFVSLISHELRTPLTALRWSVEAMHTETKGPNQILDSMDLAIHRMRTLVTAIIDVSLIEAGSFSIENVPIDMPELFENIIKELRPFIERKHIAVETSLDHGLRTINSDKRLVQVILSSLVTNAIKYSDNKGVVTIQTREEGKDLVVDIKNTGEGIPLEDREQIFTKMFRATNAQSLNPDGTGLGLYISKSFIERLGGAITFSSVPGEETVFTVRLPFGAA